MIARIASALAAVAAGVVYAWRTERHAAGTVKIRKVPIHDQDTEPFPPIPSNGHRP